MPLFNSGYQVENFIKAIASIGDGLKAIAQAIEKQNDSNG